MNKSNTNQNSKLNHPLDNKGFGFTRAACKEGAQAYAVFQIIEQVVLSFKK